MTWAAWQTWTWTAREAEGSAHHENEPPRPGSWSDPLDTCETCGVDVDNADAVAHARTHCATGRHAWDYGTSRPVRGRWRVTCSGCGLRATFEADAVVRGMVGA